MSADRPSRAKPSVLPLPNDSAPPQGKMTETPDMLSGINTTLTTAAAAASAALQEHSSTHESDRAPKPSVRTVRPRPKPARETSQKSTPILSAALGRLSGASGTYWEEKRLLHGSSGVWIISRGHVAEMLPAWLRPLCVLQSLQHRTALD